VAGIVMINVSGIDGVGVRPRSSARVRRGTCRRSEFVEGVGWTAARSSAVVAARQRSRTRCRKAAHPAGPLRARS